MAEFWLIYAGLRGDTLRAMTDKRKYLGAGLLMLALTPLAVYIGSQGPKKPPETVNTKTLRCFDLRSGFMDQEGWKPTHSADEWRVLNLVKTGKAEILEQDSLECFENARPDRRFLVRQQWWRIKKR